MPVIGTRVPREAVADDDRRSVDRGPDGSSRSHGQFGCEFALLVLVVECLAAFDFRFENRSQPLAAYKRGGDMMEFANTPPSAQVDQPVRRQDIGCVRFAIGTRPKRHTRGRMHNAVAPTRKPNAIGVAQPEVAFTEIPGENGWLREICPYGGLGKFQHFFHAIPTGCRSCGTNEDRNSLARAEEVAK